MNQRRCEALRAYFTEGLTYERRARFGYTRWAMIDLVRTTRSPPGHLSSNTPGG